MHVRRKQMHIRKIIHQVLLGEIPRGHRRLFAGFRDHKRQLKRLGLGETARLVSGDHPTTIHRAIRDQVIHLSGTTAQLHKGVQFNLDTPSGIRLNLISPRLHKVFGVRRRRRDEVLEPQRHLLGERARSAEQEGSDEGRFKQGHN